MTAAERVRAYVEAHAIRPFRSDVISWVVNEDNEEHVLTVADLRELLAEVIR